MEEIFLNVGYGMTILINSLNNVSKFLITNQIFLILIGTIIFSLSFNTINNLINFIKNDKEDKKNSYKDSCQPIGEEDWDDDTPIYDPFKDPANYTGKGSGKITKEEDDLFTDDRMYNFND